MTDPTSAPWPDEALSLFRERPERFIAARDDLVRRLRDEDRATEAQAIKALRKPTVVTWALNQLVSTDPDGVAALLDAGAEVRAVQQAALSSAKDAGTRLKAVTTARRGAVHRLVETARGLLDDAATSSPAHIDAIRRALETASTDPDVGEQLRHGILERAPKDAAGFGDLAGLTLVPAEAEGSAGDRARGSGAKRSTRRAAAPPDAQRVRAERARLQRDRDAAVREARKAREAADRYAQELEAMQRRLAVVKDKHREAETTASRRELDAKRAERAFAKASERLDRDG
jgi:hypothetical protein